MRAIAVYSPKGGVGKTTLAVNLAWCAAALSARRTLIWDLDPQGATTFLLGHDRPAVGQASALFTRDTTPEQAVRATAFAGLDLLPADASLRNLDRLLFGLGKKRRLQRLIEALARRYDSVVFDCPPGLTETTEQVVRAADVMVVPVIPSALSRRAFEELAAHLGHAGRRPAMLPVFSMVDRRRGTHQAALAEDPAWPVIPMASVVEGMSARRSPLGAFAPTSPAARAVGALWTSVERKLSG